MRLKNEKKFCLSKTFFPAAAVLIPILTWVSLGWLLPEKLTLLQGQTMEISTKLPVSARTEESVGVLGVTTEPLADQLHLELGTAITAEPKKAGNTEVTFYLCNTVPLKTVQAQVLPRTELVPVGRTLGVTMDTKGLLVLGTGFVDGENNEVSEPCKGVLETGDLILQANGKTLENKEAFLETVENSGGQSITLRLARGGKEKEVEITPAFSAADQAYKLGVWIRDSIQGIGTVTFYDPADGSFGALGHGVYDVDTGGLMVIREGTLTDTELTEIVKGQKGEPGELTGIVEMEEKLGKIRKNTDVGIYGRAESGVFSGKALPVATMDEIQEGNAVILSDLEGNGVREYNIEISSIDRSGDKKHKDMTIRVTDPRLLEKTGGIVQGMSGSPILQNDKFVGAVTHVFSKDPTRGYGIFIENMMAEL